MAKIKQSSTGHFIGVMRHKTEADRFALKFGTDIYSCDAKTLLMLAASILKSLKDSGCSTDLGSVDLCDSELETTVPITLGHIKGDN